MNKKHIIFLYSDQHNGMVTGFDGDPYIRTPVLDALAEKGTVYSNCYCSSPLCVPSRSSMMSGLLPSETGIFNNFQSLRSDRVTFAHCMSVAGYETVLGGRMHFAGPDQRHGFEKRLLGDMTPSYSHLPKNNYGEALKATDFPGPDPIIKSGAGNSAVLEFDRDLNVEMKRFLEERTDDRPLFLLAGYYGPHCPYVAPKELFDHYYETLPVPSILTPEERAALHPAIQQWIRNRGIEDVTVEDVRRVRASYYGMVEFLDTLMGEFLEVVDRTLGLENTLVFYTSDHGDTIGNNNVFWKTNFYEGSVRVPMVWSCPGLIPEGRSLEGHVSLMDVGPTLIEYAGGPALPKSDGVSLLASLTGGEDDLERYVISQLADVKGDNPSIMIRKGPWKLIHHTGYADVQLFDVEKDPDEHNDLGLDPAYGDIREELHAEVMKYWDEDHVWKVFHEAKAHDAIYRKWVLSARVEGIEEWVCPPEKNYLV